MGKKELLLEYLREHNGITAFEAYAELFDTRLGDTIYRLEKDRYNFRREPIKKIGFNGKTKNFYRYYLDE